MRWLSAVLVAALPSLSSAASPEHQAAQAYANGHAGGGARVGTRPVFSADGYRIYPVRQQLYREVGRRMRSYEPIGERQVNQFVVVRTDESGQAEALGIVPLKSFKQGALPSTIEAASTGALLHLPKGTTLSLSGQEVKLLAKDEKNGRGTYLVVPGEKAPTSPGWFAQPNTRLGDPFIAWRIPRGLVWEDLEHVAQGSFQSADGTQQATRISIKEPGHRPKNEVERAADEVRRAAEEKQARRDAFWRGLRRAFLLD
jgi:hypothetical protein